MSTFDRSRTRPGVITVAIFVAALAVVAGWLLLHDAILGDNNEPTVDGVVVSLECTEVTERGHFDEDNLPVDEDNAGHFYRSWAYPDFERGMSYVVVHPGEEITMVVTDDGPAIHLPGNDDQLVVYDVGQPGCWDENNIAQVPLDVTNHYVVNGEGETDAVEHFDRWDIEIVELSE